MDEILSPNFLVSLVVSILTACYFISKQSGFYSKTKKNLKLFRNFFNKEGSYATIDLIVDYDQSQSNAQRMVANKRLRNVALSNSEFYELIKDINDYLSSCRGTATFNIIQNKTERRIAKLYDQAASKASFPTHYGLMGTFVGVFLGLAAFLISSMTSEDGITDVAIHGLIMGVLVSMSTSFIGLRMSTKANDSLSNAKNKIDVDKNEFYEFIQNKLMPSVDINLTEALGKLHDTVTTFEPSFSRVIKDFNDTFKECTKAFGDDFKISVRKMVGAVDKMSTNVNGITTNVEMLEELLNRLSGAEWVGYMHQFADASDHFKVATQSLNDFERARRMMLAATQEAINIQKTYNDSLQIPRDVATNINGILQRVVRFEESINALGVNIEQTQLFGNAKIEEINEQISAIKKKHKVAERYMETSDEKLEKYFEGNLLDIKALEDKYLETLTKLFEEFEHIITDHKIEIDERHEIFKKAIEDKFELEGVSAELAHLKKLPSIESKVDDVRRGQEQIVSRIATSNTTKRTETKQQNPQIEQIIADAQRDKEEQIRIQTKINQNASSGTGQTKPVSSSVKSRPEPSSVSPEPKVEEVKQGFLGRIFGRNKKK